MKPGNIVSFMLATAILISPTVLLAQTDEAAPATTAATTDSSAATDTSQTDAEIIGWLQTLNENEIAAASLAKQKKLNSEVRGYADLMIADHTKNLHDTMSLSKKLKIVPAQNDVVNSMEQDGAKMKSDLEPLNGKDFQKAYIKDMVDGHSDALKKIDSYLKDVNNAKLKTLLQATRTHVNHHLMLAKKIQKDLDKS